MRAVARETGVDRKTVDRYVVAARAFGLVRDAEVSDAVIAEVSQRVQARRPAAGLVHHSDRGSPYASAEYRAVLARHGLVASMSRKGDCWDNAVAESFFGTLRAELVDHEQYATREAASRSIDDYIDTFYNIERRHSFLDYLNPIEFELRSSFVQQVA